MVFCIIFLNFYVLFFHLSLLSINLLSIEAKNLLSRSGKYFGSFSFFYFPSSKFTFQWKSGKC